jgi:hypothetical protein
LLGGVCEAEDLEGFEEGRERNLEGGECGGVILGGGWRGILRVTVGERGAESIGSEERVGEEGGAWVVLLERVVDSRGW